MSILFPPKQRMIVIKKKISFYFLCVFLLAFPTMEGAANEYGSMGAAQIGVGLGVVWGLQTLFHRRLKINISAFGLLIFCMWMAATFVWSKNPETSMKLVPSYIMAFVFYLIVLDLATVKKDVLILIACYVFGVAVLSATAIYNLISLSTYAGLSNRYSADGTDPNNFGMMLVLAIPLLYIMWQTHGFKVKWVIVAALMLFSLLIVSTASRAANISLALMFVFFLFRNRGFNNIAASLLISTVMLSVFYFLFFNFVPAESYDRLIGGLEVVGGDSRFDIWSDTLSGRNLSLFGAGSGSSLYYFGVQSHSTFLSVLFEGGVVGFLLWLFFLASHGIYLMVSWRADRSQVSWFLIASYCVLLVASSTLNWEFRKPLYFFMAIYAAWYSILKREHFTNANL